MPAKRVAFAEPPATLRIFVDFVGGHDEHRAQSVDCPQGVEQIGGAHRVGCESRNRFAHRTGDQCLRRQVKNDVRLLCARRRDRCARANRQSPPAQCHRCGQAKRLGSVSGERKACPERPNAPALLPSMRP